MVRFGRSFFYELIRSYVDWTVAAHMADFASHKNRLLKVCETRKHRFDVNNRSTVDGLDGADPQTVVDNAAHGDAVKAQRIWPIGRTRRKHACKRTAPIGAGMNFQHIASRAVQPSHNDDVVADHESVKTSSREGVHFKPGVGGALGALFRRLASRLEGGADHTNRAKVRSLAPLHRCSLGRHQELS